LLKSTVIEESISNYGLDLKKDKNINGSSDVGAGDAASSPSKFSN